MILLHFRLAGQFKTVNNGRMQGISTSILMAAFACTALCQEFEVVSVKPNKSMSNSSSSRSNQGRLTATNVSLRSLIVSGYGMKDFQVEGPEWLRSERFDLVAKFPEALPSDREKYNAALRSMMQNMLVDRFKLVVHRERKFLSVYGLTVAKGGIKFKEVPDSDSHNQDSNNTHYLGTCVSMDAFAEFLARRRDLPQDLPVLDMTGLKGFYNLTLDWVPEPRQSGDSRSDLPAVADSPSGPTLLAALQEQLGLKLETRKAPIEILVVDHAERVPSEN
jgi:uncharacterized protein (TIGR03435 family)